MADLAKAPNHRVEDMAVCVAMIGRDESGELIVTACNGHFFQMVGARETSAQTFPIAFDALVTDAADFTSRAFREVLLGYFSRPLSDAREQTHDFHTDTAHWRLSLKPIAHGDAGTRARQVYEIHEVHEVLVSGFDTAIKNSAPTLASAPPSDANTSRYRALVDLAYDAIVTMDSQHNITLFNRAAESLFGYTAAEVIGRPIVTLLPEKFRANHPQKVQRFADAYQPAVRQATPPRMDDSNSVYGQHRDGSIIPVEIAVSKIELNGTTEFMAVVRDITDRARLMQLLKKQAGTDALTGLPNRRAFLEFLEKTLTADDDLSVFILDIDFFKEINDRLGHDAGDEVLRALAQVGTSMNDGPNLFARWGGEEFVAALPRADANSAHRIADALRQRYEQQDFEYAWRGMPVPFTVSIGVVTRSAGETDVDALMKRADRALYRAKASGRNRVEQG